MSKLFTCQFAIMGKFAPNSQFFSLIRQQAQDDGIRGYITTTKKDLLRGKLEGSGASMDMFMAWLNSKPDPGIVKVEFTDLIEIKNFSYNAFTVRDWRSFLKFFSFCKSIYLKYKRKHVKNSISIKLCQIFFRVSYFLYLWNRTHQLWYLITMVKYCL